MKHLGWWVLFLFSTFALSKVLETSRALTGGLKEANFGLFLLWVVCLAIGLLALGYDAYAKAKMEGKLAREIPFFEWLGRHRKA